ncbi:gamma-glutamyltransferase [Garicola koreensis]|uniref:Gamma-glutamyltranspeptidase/glutathione hydrolase n=1 Tax=Garicola koreensis TaxID=1262554 RepID=A0A7W5XKL2_9MICC|nr:gamma-glutamyltransferase [Garicola koreensis]MBB3667055.1 gamma-glutamyltranspeptidase/glutathione hydrolase [Garicola koreensis]
MRTSPPPRTTQLAAVSLAAALALSSCGIFEEPPPPAEPVEEGESAAPGQAQPEEPSPDVSDSQSATSEASESEPTLEGQGISAAHPLAVEAGEQILADGGNAADAAIATAFAVSVVEPFASGIGGGGSAIVAGSDGEPTFYDYREVVNNDGEIPESGTGIPGFTAGMGKLHEDHGSMEWDQLLAPARQLAAGGFSVSEFLALRMTQPGGPAAVTELDHYAPGGEPLGAGDQLVQQELAETLQTLQTNGAEDYYTGELSQSLVETVEGVDAESLADYEVIVTDPVRGQFGERELIGPPPSLPGAPTIQMMQIAEANGIADMTPGSADYVDTLSQAWLVAEETVMTELGDPNFIQVPVDEMTDAQRNADIDLSAHTADQPVAGDSKAPNTTHISVVDETGMAISMTNTIMYFWGSGENVDGYFVNNHLSRFDAIDSAANEPEPGRRTVTWSNPMMVFDAEGRPELVIGSPGGHQILNILGTVFTQWGLQGADLESAVQSPRFRAEGETLYLEASHTPEQVASLQDAGWSTEIWPNEQSSFGSVQPMEVDYESGELYSVDDHRRDGAHSILD